MQTHSPMTASPPRCMLNDSVAARICHPATGKWHAFCTRVQLVDPFSVSMSLSFEDVEMHSAYFWERGRAGL